MRGGGFVDAGDGDWGGAGGGGFDGLVVGGVGFVGCGGLFVEDVEGGGPGCARGVDEAFVISAIGVRGH